jgi:hypothetical protein
MQDEAAARALVPEKPHEEDIGLPRLEAETRTGEPVLPQTDEAETTDGVT